MAMQWWLLGGRADVCSPEKEKTTTEGVETANGAGEEGDGGFYGESGRKEAAVERSKEGCGSGSWRSETGAYGRGLRSKMMAAIGCSRNRSKRWPAVKMVNTLLMDGWPLGRWLLMEENSPVGKRRKGRRRWLKKMEETQCCAFMEMMPAMLWDCGGRQWEVKL